MKISNLGTDRALDVLCELTPYVSNIATDQQVIDTAGKMINAVDSDGEALNKYGMYLLFMERISEIVPLLFKTHRADVYGILSIFNEMSVEEIKTQNLLVTMEQAREVFRDKEFLDFFRSLAGRAQTA